MEAPPLAIGATAELLAWKDGHVLKLFRERSPYHGHGLAATRAASATGLPVPMVVDGLIEVEDREGVVFEHRGAGRAASPGDAPCRRAGTTGEWIPPFLERIRAALAEGRPQAR